MNTKWNRSCIRSRTEGVCICAVFGEAVGMWGLILQLIHNHNGRISRQGEAKFSTKRPAWSSCLLLFPPPPSVWRIVIAPRGSILRARGRLNSSYRKDPVKFECILFDVLKVRVTFGFRRRGADGAMFYAVVSVHFQPFCWRCQTFAWLWSLESRKLEEVSGRQHWNTNLSEVLVRIGFSRTVCLL